MTEANPFLRYRERLDSYEAVRLGKMSDDQFVDVVGALDSAIAGVEGHGFVETPVVEAARLAEAAGLDVDLWIKAEPNNVAGSHKARHLMGVAIHMLVDEALGAPKAERLAIASCGNAALGAGVIGAALKRPLDVYVPTWADEPVVERLNSLGAAVTHCPRIEGEVGDPAYLRFREAVANGARAFSVQGTDTPTTFDGGRTLGWELADQLANVDSLYVQVGGGALATAVSMGYPSARLNPVQAEGCAPLKRAWDALGPSHEVAEATGDEMYAWEDPQSLASGILDDVTYDWKPLLERTLRSGGEPIVATESEVVRAYELGRDYTEISASATGTAGLAGLLAKPPRSRERVAVLFTGIDSENSPSL